MEMVWLAASINTDSIFRSAIIGGIIGGAIGLIYSIGKVAVRWVRTGSLREKK